MNFGRFILKDLSGLSYYFGTFSASCCNLINRFNFKLSVTVLQCDAWCELLLHITDRPGQKCSPSVCDAVLHLSIGIKGSSQPIRIEQP